MEPGRRWEETHVQRLYLDICAAAIMMDQSVSMRQVTRRVAKILMNFESLVESFDDFFWL